MPPVDTKPLDVAVYMSNADAEKFLLFQKYYDLFNTLDKKAVFDIDFGKVTINIAYGDIQNVVSETMVWRK